MREYLCIEFDREDRTYRVGESVTGKVLIRAPSGDQCKAVRLRTYWRTHGKGNADKGEPTVTRLHTGPLSREHLHEFRFEFPAPPGPFTYHGRFLNVDQYVEVQVDQPWARDPRRAEEYVLLPGLPVAPPPPLLEAPERPVEQVVPGCSAAIGSIAMVVGLIMMASVGAEGFLFLLAGGFFYLPYFKTLGETRMGNASAYLTSLVVAPGEKAEVEVKVFPRKLTRINMAVLEVAAQEVCVAGSGSSRRTHTHKLFKKVVALSGAMELEGREPHVFHGSVRIPEGVPTSFRGGANKILWEARVKLDIPNWPDWVKRIPFVVWPGEDRLLPEEEMEALLPPFLGLGAEEPVEEETREPETEAEPDPEVVPELEPVPGPDVEPASEPPDAPLHLAVTAILEAQIFGGERDLLIRDLKGRTFEFTLEVKRVDRTFGAFTGSEYRNGQTVTGTIIGSDQEVTVYFPEARNEEVKGWEPGSSHVVRGVVNDWDRLRKRPELLAKG